jgi:hypothetical protein
LGRDPKGRQVLVSGVVHDVVQKPMRQTKPSWQSPALAQVSVNLPLALSSSPPQEALRTASVAAASATMSDFGIPDPTCLAKEHSSYDLDITELPDQCAKKARRAICTDPASTRHAKTEKSLGFLARHCGCRSACAAVHLARVGLPSRSATYAFVM